MKGYKAFNKGFVCRDFQYEIGKEYTLEGDLKICKNGFHFCKNLIDVFGYYSFERENIVLAEVEATGDIVQEGTKYCTNKIKIIRPVEWSEVDDLIKGGFDNTGDNNSGRCNRGNYNSGSYNSGSYNSGSYNSGNYNSGWLNCGHCNTGNYNIGNSNSGYYNSGDNNSGRRNSGCYNSGDWNSGFFNSNEPTVRLFNKDSGMTFSEIIKLHINWSNLEESKNIIQKLPNYDAQIFYWCTGIDWRE